MSNTSAAPKRPTLLLLILTFGLHALRAFVICPLKVQVNTNIVYMTTVWPVVLDVLADLLQMAVIYIAFAFILETFFHQGFHRAMPLILGYIGAFVFGAAANLVMDVTVGGGGEYFVYLLFPTLAGIGQELLQLGVVLIIARIIKFQDIGPVCPPEKIFSAHNGLQLSALCAAGVTALFRLTARIIYDIDLGLPASAAETVEMVSGYAGDLLIPALGYLGMILLLMRGGAKTAE
ncbi:MAG: hypothetical protein IJZ02_05035 [Clostridia bacterium]|nr:hypothetical protein [Clostridia bacterium]